MTATDLAARHDHEPSAAVSVLPPYSGEDAVRVKCCHEAAYTWYRPALECTATQEWNSDTVRRGPLPERLERECQGCSYRWDEALAVERAGMSVAALAHALNRAGASPADGQSLERVAHELLGMLRVTARPGHPIWQYSDGTAPADRPAICEEVHLTREDEDACEQRRAPKESL